MHLFASLPGFLAILPGILLASTSFGSGGLELPDLPANCTPPTKALSPAAPSDEVSAMRAWLERSPAEALACLESGDAGPSDRSPGDRETADLLELRARALIALGRAEEAVSAMQASVELDPGTVTLRRVDRSGRTVAGVEIGSGGGRLRRAAELLASRAPAEQVRALASRAVASGRWEGFDELWRGAGGTAVPGLDPDVTELRAPVWYPELPDLELQPPQSGDPIRTADARGSVLVLDFWASWCEPCRDSLPRLQELYESERANGLRAIAVNAQESAEMAIAFAASSELTIPVAMYDDAADRALRVRSLPVTVIVDRWGRVRKRWDGYREGTDAEIETTVRELLAEQRPPPGERLGEVLLGASRLGLRWARDTRQRIDGLAVASIRERRSILIGAGRGLAVHEPDGRLRRNWPAPRQVGELSTRQTEGGSLLILAYRAGGDRISWFRLPEGDAGFREAASPIFSARIGSVDAGTGRPGVLYGTVDGLWAAGPDDGAEAQRVEAVPARWVSDIRVSDLDPTEVSVLLPGEEALLVLDSDLREVRRIATEPGSRTARAGDGGSHVILPGAAVHGVSGRFVPEWGESLAIALEDGQLVVIDRSELHVRFRARWEGITALAAGDLDGDGVDELVVGADRTLAVLSAR